MRKEYQLNKDTYNKVAQSYAVNAFQKQWMRDYVNKFSKMIKPYGTLLDLGCGPGNDVFLFTELGFDVTGVDLSEEMVSEARRRVPSATFQVSSMVEIEFPHSSFDAVWSVGSLHHIDYVDFGVTLNNAYKWLKQDGKAFISTKSGKGEGIETQIQIGVGSKSDKYWVYWQGEKLIEILEKIGYKIIEVTETEPERKKDLPEGFTESWLNVWMEK